VAAEVATHAAPEAVAWIDAREHGEGELSSVFRKVGDWARRHPEGLVVIDNADPATEEVAAAIGPLVRVVPTVRVLIASRHPIAGLTAAESVRPLELAPDDADEEAVEASPSVQLLRAALSELAPDATLTSAEANRLAHSAGGLPLVLRLVAAAARALPPEAILARGPSLEGDPIDLATRAVLEALDRRSAAAFRDLTVLTSEFDLGLAAGVTGLDESAMSEVMVQLVSHSLVEVRLEHRLPYSILGPLRAVGHRVLRDSGELEGVLDRHAATCLARAARATRADDAVTELTAQMTADLAEHRRALEHLVRRGDAEGALTLACRLEVPLYTLGWWAEKVELLDAALSVPGPPSPMRARAHAFRARPGPMHHFDLKHAERAEQMAQDLDHQRLVAFARHLRSIGLWWSGRADEAVALALTASEALAEADLVTEWCEARKFLGVAMIFDGDADRGLEVQHDVLAVVRSRGTPFGIAHNLAYLGHSHRLLGDDAAALADLSEARELCQRVGNRGTAIHVSVALAEIAADRGDAALALERVGEALDLMRRAQSHTYEPWAWTVAMRAHALDGDVDAALACAWRAIEGLAIVPSGETVRLATELAHMALELDDVVTASRLLGVLSVTADRRELPFPSPREGERLASVQTGVRDRLGAAADDHVASGRRCTVSEAAGDLLTR
jgi:hypothetical protein